MTPAQIIIDRFGGARKIAALLGVDPSAVYRWGYPKNKGGTGGAVPSFYHAKILSLADEHNVEVAPSDLVLLPGQELVH